MSKLVPCAAAAAATTCLLVLLAAPCCAAEAGARRGLCIMHSTNQIRVCERLLWAAPCGADLGRLGGAAFNSSSTASPRAVPRSHTMRPDRGRRLLQPNVQVQITAQKTGDGKLIAKDISLRKSVTISKGGGQVRILGAAPRAQGARERAQARAGHLAGAALADAAVSRTMRRAASGVPRCSPEARRSCAGFRSGPSVCTHLGLQPPVWRARCPGGPCSIHFAFVTRAISISLFRLLR